MAMTRRAVVLTNHWAAALQNVAGFPRAVLTFDNLADYNDSHAADVPRAANRLRSLFRRAGPPESRMQSTDKQIEVSPDDPTMQVTSARTPVQCDRYRLTVRARAGNLRVVAAWQVLGCEAHHADHVRVRVDRRHGYEEMTITFAAVTSDTLAAMVDRLIALPWALDAYFYP
ncbi:hypothetical protein SAMN05192563_104511 [Paraburkholderia aspalathi]|uniref:Uncharacterized protein n=2 Tax=Paraburkholderia aspalathi TaxID=1324617 RepID=A0A1I7EPY9_9BURK|nr:hypothetical protein SAMN05192563_104511 [Paraburkholderia aspalathi]